MDGILYQQLETACLLEKDAIEMLRLYLNKSFIEAMAIQP